MHTLFITYILIYFTILLVIHITYVHTASQCPDLQNPNNGRVIISGTTIGSVASYICDDGYVIDGLNTRICQDQQTWSGSEPQCRSKQSMTLSFVQFCIYSSFHLSIHPFTHLFIHPSIHLSIHPLIHAFTMHLCIHPSIHSSISTFICTSIHPSIY